MKARPPPARLPPARPLRLSVWVQPRASRNEWAGRHGDALKVRLTAPPVDNAANTALIAFVAKSLDVPRNAVRLIGGASSRHKVLEVDGISQSLLESRLISS